jgi:hypothetical protein
VLASVLAASGCGSGAKLTAHYTTTPPTAGGAMSQPIVQRGSHDGAGTLVVPISGETRRSLEQHLFTARFLAPTRLAIPKVVGSSNCPSVPDKLIVESPHAIHVNLVVGSWSRSSHGVRVQVPHKPRICLADAHLVPVVIRIDPAQIDVHHQLKVSLYFPKFAIRRYRRPVVVTVPPLATALVREEVRVARASNPRLFSIFPAVPGKRPCAILDGGTHIKPLTLQGICETSVRSRPTHELSVSVSFTESWEPNCPRGAFCKLEKARHHTWQIIEGETVAKPGTKPHIYATHSRGATAPQDYK